MENVPPIQAILESQTRCKSFTRVSTMQFFRDEQSRTRVEQSGLASIHDPISGQSYTLDPAKKLAFPGAPKVPGMAFPKIPAVPGVTLPQMPGMRIPQAPGALPQAPQPPKEIADLGQKTIDGIKVSGKQLAFTVPGKPQPLMGEVWTSKDLQLPIHSTVTDPATGCVMQTQMKNVQSGVKLDPGMFKVPADFKIAAPPASPK
jgi:hypothetical protein